MIKIVKIQISRFRSIINIDLSIDEFSNLIAICGQNNVGKTNLLRALNIFFKPEEYNKISDIPQIKLATGGQATHPKIIVQFYDTVNNLYYEITRNFKDYKNENKGLTGVCYQIVKNKKTNWKSLSILELDDFLCKIEFVFIDSINVFMPELIEKITEDMLDVQYDRARFSESKKNLKESYETYVNGLQDILDSFASDISSTFKTFKDSWRIKFQVPNNSNTFKDLISNDVFLFLDDKGSNTLISKGSGLQRLTAILLYFEMLKRLKKRKQIIFCIDEPDVYLHEGLQKKLKNFFDKNSVDIQIFYTTHSKVFINPYNMCNVFLLNATNREQFSTRKQKNIDVTETYKIDIANDDGYSQICEHLGIEKVCFEVLENKNLLVEGECDKKYLTEIGRYFGLEVPNIEVLNGADNAIKFLEFYESYYKNNQIKPKIKVVLDNDLKGREIFQKIINKLYHNIKVDCVLLQNYNNTANIHLTNNNTNNEIEDFIYPELICFLVNVILSKKGMRLINSDTICKNIQTKAFNAKGILALCEYEKNLNNPDIGDEISFVSSGNNTNRLKEGLAGLFNLQANQKLLPLMRQCSSKYPSVKETLIQLFNFDS